jgi:hypothetical protein
MPPTIKADTSESGSVEERIEQLEEALEAQDERIDTLEITLKAFAKKLGYTIEL